MDDVHWLQTNPDSSQESYLFLVDSRKRNAGAYPTAAEFVVEFDRPFRNVFGLDLIDASVARSEYGIEKYSNTLVYSLAGSPDYQVATLTPADYNLQQLTDALNAVLQGGLRVDPRSTPYELTNALKFSCPVPFTIHVSRSSMSRALGLLAWDGSSMPVPTTSDVVAVETPGAQETNRTHLGPYPLFETEAVYGGGPKLRQPFVAEISGTVVILIVHASVATQEQQATLTVVDASGTVYATATLTPHVSPQATVLTAPAPLLRGQIYYLVIESSSGTAQTPMGVYRSTSTDVGVVAQLSAGSGNTLSWTALGSGEAVCCEVWTAASAGSSYQVSPAGVVDLTGQRYLLVRCPELESLMYRDRAFDDGVHCGLGMVRLQTNGYREQTFDFKSFPAREFHPIGRVSRLHFRLERPDGSLYDTKGLDVTLTLVIRYYDMKARPHPQGDKQLNPTYDARQAAAARR